MRVLLRVLSISLMLAPGTASAVFHLWDITEVYSNADGSVQFIEFATNVNSQDELAGHTLASNLWIYTFPTDLDPDELGNGNNATANTHMLVATPAFASQPGAVAPDFVLDIPEFFDLVQDSLDFAGVDTFAWASGALPTNGVDSLNEPFGSNARSVAVNTPTNFAGEIGEVPEPSRPGALLVCACIIFALARRREKAHAACAVRS